MKRKNPPVNGYWNLYGFPDYVNIGGRIFRRATWKDTTYPGVIEQYREDVVNDSMHLKIYENITWVIDHADKYNPDRGQPIEHFFADHPLGQLMGGLLAVAGATLLAAGIAKAIENI